MTEATETARAYYDAIDAGDYDRFADLLAPDVVHERPDRTIEGRETLVAFMREGRPNEETAHEVEAVYVEADGGDVAVRGRLRDADGAPMFAFVDVFEVEAAEEDRTPRISRIRTYTQ
ncbi:nuclear transport factor 2 family protein [Halorussus sp. MSC15.2]|uniref:nuclear transport factor 2 family protein n=1 Tax=Halorussus sp. MSC15.2 TaxID=2283638 RepID=UPI0013D06B38|nr:nuclear transport factor 2 family protein [Halorussus sp. MSC15.2]NEU55470.1 nuclear transport factor 2 family protein [Halorussus sp. MSC15.2]